MTVTDQQPIAKSGSVVLISQVVLAIISFAFIGWLARQLSRVELAQVAVYDILIAVMMISEFGLLSVATQKAPAQLLPGRNKAEALALIKCALTYQTLILLLLSIGAWIFSVDISRLLLKDTDYAWIIRLFMPGAIATIWFFSLQSIAQIKHDFFLLARWNLINGFLRPVLAITGYLLADFPGLLIGLVITPILTDFGMAWSLRGLIFTRTPMAPFWSTFQYGFPLYLRNLFRYGFTQFDQILVAIFLTPNALATYNIVQRLRKQLIIAVDAYENPILMRLASLRQDSDPQQADFFRKANRMILLTVLPGLLLVTAASPWLMSVFGGSKYSGDWPLLALMSLATAGYALFNLYGGVIFARMQPWYSFLLDGISGGLNYVLMPLLGIALAANGVVFSQVIGYVSGLFIAVWLAQRLPGVRFDRKSLSQVLIPLLLACGVIVAGQTIHSNYWIVPLYILTAGILYLFLLSRKLNQDDWAQIRHFIPRRLLPAWETIERILSRQQPSHPASQ